MRCEQSAEISKFSGTAFSNTTSLVLGTVIDFITLSTSTVRLNEDTLRGICSTLLNVMSRNLEKYAERLSRAIRISPVSS